MAENMKNLNTRIRLKYDTLENWIKNDPVLLAGEVAIATVANNETNANSTRFQNLPNVVMKVGDGTKKFSELNYFSAMAADVYAWAKSPTRPEYEAKDIVGLADFISGKVQDTNTKFKLEQDANNTHILRLYSQDLGQADWTLVNEITTADTVYDDTALAGRVTSLEGLVGAEKVSTQIANAIAALDLDNKYDAKGAAAQALTDAKAYADGKDAAIKAAKDAADAADAKAVAAQGEIDALEEKVGEVPTDKTVVGMIGENATAITDEAKRAGDAEAALAAKIGEVAEGENLAGKLAAEVERATEAEEAAAGAAAAAQKTADDLAALVGTLPADAGEGIDTIVKYIDKKTADITSGTDFTELANRVKTIEDDYLVEADKTELAGLVTAEKERAEGIEGGLRTDVDKANEAIGILNGGVDVVGSVDKKIADAFTAANLDQYATDDDLAGVAAQVTTLVGEDANKSVRAIANEELAKQLIAEGAQESLDTLAEIAAWIQEHPDDAAAMNKAIDDLEALVGTLPEGATATTVVGYVDEVVAALKIGDYAKAADLLALTGRVEAMEAKVANWDAAEQNAKDYADGLNTAMNTRVEALEAIDHDHANKAELDLIAAGDKAKWDAAEAKAHEHANKALLDTYTQTEADLADAVAKKHEHANAEELTKFVDGDKAKLDDAAAKAHEHANAGVLDGITAEQVAAWDAAEGNAKGYADELNTAMDERVTKNTNDIAGLHAIAKSGNVNDLEQTEGEYIVFCCGTSDTII